MSGKGYKIVYVQESSPRQVFTDPKSRNGNYTIWFLHKGKPIADVFLTPNLGKKLVLRNVRAKLPHYGITSSNLCVSCGDVNVHAYSVMAPNAQVNQPCEAVYLFWQNGAQRGPHKAHRLAGSALNLL
jgi:hypothetical protein